MSAFENAAAAYSAGLRCADQGLTDEAIQHWQRAVTLEPRHADAQYNLAQAFYNRGEFVSALTHWQAALDVLPNDFETIKKIVQTQRALGRWDDANSSMMQLFDAYNQSRDEAVIELFEVTVEQFTVSNQRVMASEMLRPRDPDLYYETVFRVLDDQNVTVMTVQLESSQYGRDTGAPYIIGVTTAAGHQAIGPVFNTKPSYQSVREIAVRLIESHIP